MNQVLSRNLTKYIFTLNLKKKLLISRYAEKTNFVFTMTNNINTMHAMCIAIPDISVGCRYRCVNLCYQVTTLQSTFAVFSTCCV